MKRIIINVCLPIWSAGFRRNWKFRGSGDICLYILLFFVGSVHGSFIDTLMKQTGDKLRPAEVFFGMRQEKENLLIKLRKEKQALQDTQAITAASIKEQVSEVNSKIIAIKHELKILPDDDFLNTLLFTYNEINQVLQDILGSRDQLGTLLDDFIKVIQAFLLDPDFGFYRKENKLYDHYYYSFEDLEKLHQKLLEQEKQVAHLSEQEKSARADLEVHKKNAASLVALIKKKEEELQVSSKVVSDEMIFEAGQTADLLRAQEKLYEHKKVLNELLLQEAEYKINFLSMESYIAKSELDILKAYLRKIKLSIRISEADIMHDHDKFLKWKGAYYSSKELYRKQIDLLRENQKRAGDSLKELSQKYAIGLSKELDEWTKDVAQTVESYVHFAQIGALNTENILLSKKIKFIEAQLALQDEELNYETISLQVKESYHNIISRKLMSDEDVAREVKKYEVPRAEAKTREMRYAEKATTTAESLSSQKKVLDNLVQRRKDLAKLRNTVFKLHQTEYTLCLNFFSESEKNITDQIDVLGKMSGVYASIMATIARINRLISFIKAELDAHTLWYRPEYAITWLGVKNIALDIATFLVDVRSYITRFEIRTFIKTLQESINTWYQFFMLLFKFFVMLAFCLIVRLLMPIITARLLAIHKAYAGFTRFTCLLVLLFLSFIRTHFVSIAVWWMVFWFLQFSFMQDQYVYIIFYLFSIPYFLYLAHRFVQASVIFNMEYDYALFAQDFQRRFVWVFTSFLYATVVIALFRESFMLANYYKSELPVILKAINYIIFQISLIFLLTKEQIIAFIPRRTEFWRWVSDQVDNYYYFILCIIVAIIIMSNPYVGFGRLVLHIFFNLLYSGMLMIGLYWFYAIFKRVISRMFFSTDHEVTRERFASAKTWFGLLIIGSFIAIAFIGILVSAKIWGWQVHFKDIMALISEPFLRQGTANPISVMSLLYIFSFIIGGFIFSYILDTFVLGRIFDLLLVDQGVQHTVTSIMRYIVVTAAVFIGFINQGLGELVSYIVAAMALSIGWVLKEPIMDFVSYFIILVQRPIKIGDYIQLDKDTAGVVRRITARAVVLRRKNSTTIMVPNSQVASKTLVNWNYSRNFIAFNDIYITIAYTADPVAVKELLIKVVMSHPNVLKNPPVTVRLDNFKEIGFEFMVRGYISSVYTLEQWNIASDVRLAIVKALRENNIEIAVPAVRIIRTEDNILYDGSDSAVDRERYD